MVVFSVKSYENTYQKGEHCTEVCQSLLSDFNNSGFQACYFCVQEHVKGVYRHVISVYKNMFRESTGFERSNNLLSIYFHGFITYTK